MARVTSNFLKGSIDDITFVNDGRGTYAKLKPTVDKERIFNDPRSEGTRRGMREMGGASMAAKAFRTALAPYRIWMDQYFSGRLSGAFRKVTGAGAGETGMRTFDLRKNGDAFLSDFEFQENDPLLKFMGGDYQKPTTANNRQELFWTSPKLNRVKEMSPPAEASHFKYYFGVIGLSNYHFDSEKMKYSPISDWQEPALLTATPHIPLTGRFIQPRHLELKFEKPIPEEVGLIAFVGIEFWKEINGKKVLYGKHRSMRVLGIV